VAIAKRNTKLIALDVSFYVSKLKFANGSQQVHKIFSPEHLLNRRGEGKRIGQKEYEKGKRMCKVPLNKSL
jgi:hypothetical protein